MVQEILIFAVVFTYLLMAVKYCKPTPDVDDGARAAMQSISVAKGGVIVFRATTKINSEQAAAIHGYFERCFGEHGVKVLILSDGVELVGSIQLEQDHSACQCYRGNYSPLSEPEINAKPN